MKLTTLVASGIVIIISGAALAWQLNEKVPLPPPFASPSSNNRPRVIPRPNGAQLQVPAGFAVDEYAADFKKPRFMLEGPSQEVLLSDSADKPDGTVYAWVDGKKDFHPAERKKLVTGLDRPYGLALWKDYLYIAESTSVKRYKYDSKAMTAGPGEEVVSLKGFDKGHWTRTIMFDPKGAKMYLGVGSSSNVDAGDPEMRAAISRFNPDGSGAEIYAAGTRNPIGLRFYPGTQTLWAAVQERDLLGDDLVPDFFTHVRQGAFYGFPFAYAGPNEDPRRKGERPDLVKKTIAGDVLLQSHVAVLDCYFYTGKQFPARYQGGAFLAFHGSWNRAKRVGQSVGFIPFKNGKPTGPVEEFLTGWMISPESRDVWGRPVGLLQLHDGSLLVSDDGGNRIWRISHQH